MRWIHACLAIIVIAILSAGCTQPAPQPAPAPTFMPEPTPVPVVTTGVPVQKQINVTAVETATEVIVTYNGGADAADLVALKIRINNQDGTTIQRTILQPEPGAQWVFTYRGNANARLANIVGVFTGGVEQTVLMEYF
ncbi:MAG: hypothetical protein GYA23_12960 [Methanomicrobiales archaeon]|nr:hypothetical protein [Methanomicrobiales archaeon]